MTAFIRFFLGTPRRFLVTLVGVVIVAGIEHFYPGAVGAAVYQAGFGILSAVLSLVQQFAAPLIIPLGALAIALHGIRMILFGGRRR